jgi:hypothetical protein
MFLRCFVHDNPHHWRHWLPLAEFWDNSLHHSALGMFPFKALYGCEPNMGAFPPFTEDNMLEADLILRDRQVQLDNIKMHLANAQNRMKLQADHHRSEKEFTVGDKVFLKLQPYA